MYSDFVPKFVKQYASVGQDMKNAFKNYITEVKEGTFPAEEHTFKINDEVLNKLY